MKLIAAFILFLGFSFNAFSISGRWLGCGNWGISYFTIKRDGTVKRYTEGCTDRGSISYGSWSRKADTMTFVFEDGTTTFIKRGRHLDIYDPKNKTISPSNLRPTACMTIWGARKKAIRVNTIRRWKRQLKNSRKARRGESDFPFVDE